MHGLDLHPLGVGRSRKPGIFNLQLVDFGLQITLTSSSNRCSKLRKRVFKIANFNLFWNFVVGGVCFDINGEACTVF